MLQSNAHADRFSHTKPQPHRNTRLTVSCVRGNIVVRPPHHTPTWPKRTRVPSHCDMGQTNKFWFKARVQTDSWSTQPPKDCRYWRGRSVKLLVASYRFKWSIFILLHTFPWHSRTKHRTLVALSAVYCLRTENTTSHIVSYFVIYLADCDWWNAWHA